MTKIKWIVIGVIIFSVLFVIRHCTPKTRPIVVKPGVKVPVKVIVDGVKIETNKPKIEYNKKTGVISIDTIKSKKQDGTCPIEITIPDIKVPKNKFKVGMAINLGKDTNVKTTPVLAYELLDFQCIGIDGYSLNLGVGSEGLFGSINKYLFQNSEWFIGASNTNTCIGIMVRF